MIHFLLYFNKKTIIYQSYIKRLYYTSITTIDFIHSFIKLTDLLGINSSTHKFFLEIYFLKKIRITIKLSEIFQNLHINFLKSLLMYLIL